MNPTAFLRRLMHSSARRLTRWAAVFALLGLLVFAASLLYPKPLVVIFSMSAGHVIGGFAFGLYLLAVVGDTLGPDRVLTEDEDDEGSPSQSDEKKHHPLKKNVRDLRTRKSRKNRG